MGRAILSRVANLPRKLDDLVSAWFGRDRRSSNLGREPDPTGEPIALMCEVGGLRPVRTTVSRPWSPQQTHPSRWKPTNRNELSVPEQEFLGVDQHPAEVLDSLPQVLRGGKMPDGGLRLGLAGFAAERREVELPGDLGGASCRS